MKKILMTVVMMFMFGMNVFANAEKIDVEKGVKKFEMKVNQRRLACVLDMTVEQMESTDNIIRQLDENMAFAGSMDNEERQNKIVGNAVMKNLKHMHYILKDDQYKKYVMLLNLTLRNKGFEIEKITVPYNVCGAK